MSGISGTISVSLPSHPTTLEGRHYYFPFIEGEAEFQKGLPRLSISMSVAEVGFEPRALTPKQKQCNGTIKTTQVSEPKFLSLNPGPPTHWLHELRQAAHHLCAISRTMFSKSYYYYLK